MMGREATPVPMWAAIVAVRHRLELHVQRRHPAARRHLHAAEKTQAHAFNSLLVYGADFAASLSAGALMASFDWWG